MQLYMCTHCMWLTNECTCTRSHDRKVLQLLHLSLIGISNYFISHTCGVVGNPSVHVYVVPQVIVISFSCMLVFAMVEKYLY